MKNIKADTHVEFKEYTELSFLDTGDTHVQLSINGDKVGKCEIWKDAEQDGREYIILNNEIIHLDTISGVIAS